MLEILRARLATMNEQRAAYITEMDAISAAAVTEERDASPDEDARFDELVGLVGDLDGDIAIVRDKIAKLEEIERNTIAAQKLAPFNIGKAATTGDLFDVAAIRSENRSQLHERVGRLLNDDKSYRHEVYLDADERAAVDRLLRRDTRNGALARRIMITGNPVYRSAFEKVMANNPYALTPDENMALAEARAASLTDAAGGYAVPFTLDPTIIDTGTHSVNPFRMLGTVKTTVTDTWNGVTSAGVTASWDAEGAEVSDDAPTLAAAAITPAKAQVFVPFSIEVGMDWANMENDVRAMFAVAKDDLEATAHAVGTGSGQPTGVVTALDGTASELSPATAEVFAVADLYAMVEALPARHRARASWVSNVAIMNDIRQFGTADSHALIARLADGTPEQLLGRPWYESSAMDDGFNPAVTADNFILLFGDMSKYYIVDRVGMNVDLVPHLFHTSNNRPSGQRGLYGFWRTGADVVDDGAIRVLNIATTL